MLTVGAMVWLVGCTPDVIVGADGEGTSPKAPDTTPEHAGGSGRSAMLADPLASGSPFSDRLPASATEDEGDAMLFGERITEMEILLDDRARGSLASDPGTDVMATLVVDEVAYVVGVHLKGRMSFRSLSEKPALRVDMGEYIDGATLYGVRRFTLQNMVQDSSMMAEHVFHALARASGVPNPRHGFAQLRVNGRDKGLYGILESADEAFLRRWFEDHEGNLYEGGWGADVRAGDADDFTLEESGLATPAPEDLEAMVARVTRDEVAGISACFDRDEVLAAWAVEITTGQADGYLTWANNFLLYGEPGGSPGCGARWRMLPWGMDQAFRSNRDPFGGAAGALADACLADGSCRNDLRAATANVLVTWERLDLAGRAAETEVLIQDACERDPARELPCNQERVRRWIEDRPAEIRAYLRE